MAIASLRGHVAAARPYQDISAAELLAWRRSMLALEGCGGGSAAGLDWLLDLAGGIGWQALQSLWLHPRRRVSLRCSLAELESLWRRHRRDAEPLQYLVGRCPWRDLELSVAPGVLIPRQETEQLLDLALACVPPPPSGTPLCWADLGTGSGCLAVGLARALPGSVGLAVDASAEALRQAAANLRALLPAGEIFGVPAAAAACGPPAIHPSAPTASGVPACGGSGAERSGPALSASRASPPETFASATSASACCLPGPDPGAVSPVGPLAAPVPGVHLRQGNWWQAATPWWGHLQLVVSNPPYIPSGLLAGLDPVVRDHEPLLALDGGADGLEPIRRIVAGALIGLAPGGVLLLEHHHDQSEAVLALLAAAGLEACRSHPDLEGVLRFASARRPSGPAAQLNSRAAGGRS